MNTARPGDRAIMTGIVRAEPDFGFGQPRSRSFRSKIDANYIEVVGKEPSQVHITKEDEAIIKSIASGPDVYQKLIKSMAPGILGHEAVKEAILLLLVGGPQTVLPDGTKLRGDINVFLVGDPGVAKSEMLKFAAQVAPRGMFASGKGLHRCRAFSGRDSREEHAHAGGGRRRPGGPGDRVHRRVRQDEA